MKFLFIGLGGIGQRHLRNLRQLCTDEDEISAYRVKNRQFILNNTLQIQDNDGLDAQYNLRIFNDLDKALENRPDAVFICNPTSMHMDAMLKVANAGCDFFVEKPISDKDDMLPELLDTIKKKRLITYVGYQQRYNPCIKKAKEILDDGLLGRILSVNAEIGENVTGWHKYEDYRKMYACRKSLGGGVVLSQIHELDYLYYFFGMPQSAYAVGGKLSNLEIDVEDVVDVLLRYQTGTELMPVHIHEDYIQIPATRNCKIIGTNGRIEFDLLKTSIVQYDGEGNCIYEEQFAFDRNDMFREEMRDFITAVKRRTNTPVPVEVGVESLKIAEGILSSIKSGEIVQL